MFAMRMGIKNKEAKEDLSQSRKRKQFCKRRAAVLSVNGGAHRAQETDFAFWPN